MEDVLPWLYLKGISTGDFKEALQALLGVDAKGLSASTISRCKHLWEQEHEEWSRRNLGKNVMFIFGLMVCISTFGVMTPGNVFSLLSVSPNRAEKSL